MVNSKCRMVKKMSTGEGWKCGDMAFPPPGGNTKGGFSREYIHLDTL